MIIRPYGTLPSSSGGFTAADRALLTQAADAKVWAERAAKEAAQGGVRLSDTGTRAVIERRFTVGDLAGQAINTVEVLRDATGAQTAIAPVVP